MSAEFSIHRHLWPVQTFLPTLVLLLTLYWPPSAISQTQGESKMLNTKHNLGVGGPGTVRAMSERDICVFCHTPHVPKQFAASQLWNHEATTADYTLYSSEYLTSLSYAAPNQPNARSKMCLSCHDGTVAIGAVYNLGGSARTISIQDDITMMPAHSPAYIGTSLVNDHPLGYIYDTSKDPELVARPWPWGTPIKLDPDASNGTLECITCHEPHDNTNGKFLRVDNTNAYLCTFCHAKTGWSTSVHKTSLQTITPQDGNTTTVGEWACRNCHQTHGGKGVPYILTEQEQQSCFTSGCHGKTFTGTNTKDIETQLEKIYTHPTIATIGKHRNPDDPVSLDISNRHAECQDCHNSHQMEKGLHTPGSNIVSGVLKGVLSVIPGPTPGWQQPTTFTQVTHPTQENQICYKCHSSYAFGQVPNGVSTILGPSGVNITDQAMEFNPANKSAHPVQVGLNDQTGGMIPRALTPQQMTSDWSATGTQTMYCSDCHGNDEATSSTSPQGPHGSEANFMLTGGGKYWPTDAFGTLWSLDDIKNNKNNWQNDLFCVNCHPMATGGTFVNNVHGASEHQDASVKCITCHVAVPHGAERSRLIGYESDVPPWNYAGTGVYDRLVITGFQKGNGPIDYQKENCSMNGVCHGAQAGFYEP